VTAVLSASLQVEKGRAGRDSTSRVACCGRPCADVDETQHHSQEVVHSVGGSAERRFGKSPVRCNDCGRRALGCAGKGPSLNLPSPRRAFPFHATDRYAQLCAEAPIGTLAITTFPPTARAGFFFSHASGSAGMLRGSARSLSLRTVPSGSA
jgi:hypothetical protein